MTVHLRMHGFDAMLCGTITRCLMYGMGVWKEKKIHQEIYEAGMRTGVIAVLGFVFIFLIIMTGYNERPWSSSFWISRCRSGNPTSLSRPSG